MTGALSRPDTRCGWARAVLRVVGALDLVDARRQHRPAPDHRLGAAVGEGGCVGRHDAAQRRYEDVANARSQAGLPEQHGRTGRVSCDVLLSSSGATRMASPQRVAPADVGGVTVVAHDPERMGEVGAEQILARLDGADGPSRQVLLPTELVERSSAGRLA